MIRAFRLVFCALTLTFLTPVAAGYAQERPGTARIPVVSGQVIRDYARITFEWPAPAYVSASVKGNVLTIHFDRRANPDVSRMLRQLHPYVTKAELAENGKAMRLSLNNTYRVRSFVSGSVTGVDILHIKATPPIAVMQNAPAATPVQKKETPAPMLRKAAPAPDAVDAQLLREVPENELANLMPSAGEAEKPSEPAPANVQAQQKPLDEMTDAEALALRQKEMEAQENAAKTQAATQATAQQARNESASGLFGVQAERRDDAVEFIFPWKERVGAAAFMRGGYGWLVFGKAAALDLSSANMALAPREGQMSQISTPNATVIRFPLSGFEGMELQKEEGSFNWKVLLLPQAKAPTHSLGAEVNADAAQPHVFVAALEAQEAVSLADPVSGDELIIVPLHKAGEGVAAPRRFVDFALLASAQGLAIQKIADDVKAVLVRNGVRITTEAGASLSTGLPKPEELPRPDEPAEKSGVFFPYELWKSAEPEKLREEIQQYMQIIAQAKPGRERSESRLHLVQLFLSESQAPEALGQLALIQEEDPEFFRARRLAALAGGAQFLMYRFSDAAKEFSASELDGLPEAEFWRSMVSELLGNPEQGFDYIAVREPYVSNYPPLLHQRIAVLAADRTVSEKRYNTALKIFDELNQKGLVRDVADYMNYLMGKISVETGQKEEGMELWRTLRDNYTNSFVRGRAEFSLITEELRAKAITPDQAIERLERLSLTWRGDSLELSALNLLGELYRDKKEWAQAMRVWRDMNDAFPNTELATEAGRKMNEAFIEIFDKQTVSELSTLDQLFIFNQFRDLTPADEVGDRIIDKLTDKMIAMDLLNETAALLEQRMRFRFEREERSRVGAKLARVYLMNNQPELALNALRDSMYGDNAEQLRIERNYLTARALAGQKDYESALHMLTDDNSPEAQSIRTDIHWERKDWPHLITAVEAMLKSRGNPAAPLNADEARRVVQLAFAYVAENDSAQLQYLRDYFMPLMEESARKSVFEFVTRPDMPLTPANFDSMMQQFSDARQFIADYEARGM